MKKIIVNYGGYIFFYFVLIISLLILCTTPVKEESKYVGHTIASVNNWHLLFNFLIIMLQLYIMEVIIYGK